MKNKKLKQTAIFIGIFLAAILLTFILARMFQPPPPEEPTTAEVSTSAVEATTTMEASTTEEESTTEQTTTTGESTIIPTTTTAQHTIPGSNAPPRTTTRAPSTTTRAPATTTRATTTIRPPTTTRTPTTTTRPPSTITRPPATITSPADTLIQYGVNYGKSIGLTYRPQLTQGGEAIQGATQQSIRAKLDQAKAAGAKEFNLYAERQSIVIITKK